MVTTFQHRNASGTVEVWVAPPADAPSDLDDNIKVSAEATQCTECRTDIPAGVEFAVLICDGDCHPDDRLPWPGHKCVACRDCRPDDFEV